MQADKKMQYCRQQAPAHEGYLRRHLWGEAVVGLVVSGVHAGLRDALALLGRHVIVAEGPGASPELAPVRAQGSAALPPALHALKVRHPTHDAQLVTICLQTPLKLYSAG